MAEPTNDAAGLPKPPGTAQTNTTINSDGPLPLTPSELVNAADHAQSTSNSDPVAQTPMPQNTHKLSKLGRKLLRDIEFDDKEEFICEIRKHPFGLFVIYFVGTLITGGMFLGTITAGLYLQGDPFGNGLDLASFRPIVMILGFLLTIAGAVMTAIEAYLYRNNILIVSSEKLSQMLYRTIFDRKVSQLSIGHVQDVTVKQTGIPAHLFNYGTLVIETAGEQQNYTFTYAPFPFQCSKEIVGAHERNLQKYGN